MQDHCASARHSATVRFRGWARHIAFSRSECDEEGRNGRLFGRPLGLPDRPRCKAGRRYWGMPLAFIMLSDRTPIETPIAQSSSRGSRTATLEDPNPRRVSALPGSIPQWDGQAAEPMNVVVRVKWAIKYPAAMRAVERPRLNRKSSMVLAHIERSSSGPIAPIRPKNFGSVSAFSFSSLHSNSYPTSGLRPGFRSIHQGSKTSLWASHCSCHRWGHQPGRAGCHATENVQCRCRFARSYHSTVRRSMTMAALCLDGGSQPPLARWRVRVQVQGLQPL